MEYHFLLARKFSRTYQLTVHPSLSTRRRIAISLLQVKQRIVPFILLCLFQMHRQLTTFLRVCCCCCAFWWRATVVVVMVGGGTSNSVAPLLAQVTGEGSHTIANGARITAHHDDDAILDMLGRLATHHQQQRVGRENRPFVSLCFAQSLDGKLALYTTESCEEDNDGNDNDDDKDDVSLQADNKKQGRRKAARTTSNLAISGPASLFMTHALRSSHDAILIGGRTFAIDNPRLTNRLWQQQRAQQHRQQPTPIVLDSHLRHLHKIAGHCKAQNIIVCCSDSLDIHEGILDGIDKDNVTLLPCRVTKSGRLDLLDVLQKLQQKYGISSVMVEGGPTVIDMFVKAKLFDCLCVTVAPTILGNGLSITEPYDFSSGDVSFYRFDNDICLLYFPNKVERGR